MAVPVARVWAAAVNLGSAPALALVDRREAHDVQVEQNVRDWIATVESMLEWDTVNGRLAMYAQVSAL